MCVKKKKMCKNGKSFSLRKIVFNISVCRMYHLICKMVITDFITFDYSVISQWTMLFHYSREMKNLNRTKAQTEYYCHFRFWLVFFILSFEKRVTPYIHLNTPEWYYLCVRKVKKVKLFDWNKLLLAFCHFYI